MKIAVIGTGAAGFGVLKALEPGNHEITVFDIGEPVPEAPVLEEVTKERIADYYDRIYRKIREKHSFKFPPPKTHFSEMLPRHPIAGRKRTLHRSESLGGLTNYWGGTMLPFTDTELERWPVTSKDLAPYYRLIAEAVGISGRFDALNEYFKEDFCNRPPFQLVPVLSRLDEAVNRGQSDGAFTLRSGLNRCALETRDDKPNRCVHCGECLSGCFLGSIFSSRSYAADVLERARFVKGRVTRVDPGNRAVHVGGEVHGGFDKVFLCAGCPGSTEIVMRSAQLQEVSEMDDNAVYVFPLLYLGRVDRKPPGDPYLSLTNLIIGCIPNEDDLRFAQVQVYPNFDYLWRYNIPPMFWPVLRPLARISRHRIFWARLYVHGGISQAYRINTSEHDVSFELAREANPGPVAGLMDSIRGKLKGSGFSIPVRKPLHQKANSHYAATLPYGGERIHVTPGGEVFPGVYLCDSAPFPDLPAVSLTFTIMANACRTATEAVHD